MEYNPDVRDLLFMHAALVKQYGGSSGVRDAGALEAAVARPWGSSLGEQHFPTPFLKAAAICESVIKRRPFVDGNKRTGTAAGVYLLLTDGRRVAVERGRRFCSIGGDRGSHARADGPLVRGSFAGGATLRQHTRRSLLRRLVSLGCPTI